MIMYDPPYPYYTQSGRNHSSFYVIKKHKKITKIPPKKLVWVGGSYHVSDTDPAHEIFANPAIRILTGSGPIFLRKCPQNYPAGTGQKTGSAYSRSGRIYLTNNWGGRTCLRCDPHFSYPYS